MGEHAVANTCPGLCKRLCPSGDAERSFSGASAGGNGNNTYSMGTTGTLPPWIQSKVDEIHKRVTESLGSGTHDSSSVSPELARMAWRTWSKRIAHGSDTASIAFDTIDDVAPAVVRDMMRLGAMKSN